MIINVKAVPRSSRAAVTQTGQTYKVYLTRPAEDGEANGQLIGLIADHFGVKKYQVRILRGQTCRNKTVEIDK